MQHGTRTRHVVYDLSGSTTFFDMNLMNGTIFGKKITEQKIYVFDFH
jgi:hypothetical protein